MATKLREALAEEASEQPAVFVETVKVALYGKFGSRKSLQIGHLIDMAGADNVLVISAERGLNTIASKLTNKANVLAVTGLDELRATFLAAKAFGDADNNRWVCVDGMSQVTEWLANEQLSGAEKYYDMLVQNQTIPVKMMPFGRFLTDKKVIDSMRIYGRIGRDSENLLSAWIGLPCNLYVNYLEDMTGSSGYEKTPPYGPDVPGRVGLRAVMSSFDFIGRLSYATDGSLVGQFDSTSNYYMARTREDRTVVTIPPELGNFQLDKFVQLIKGELKVKED